MTTAGWTIATGGVSNAVTVTSATADSNVSDFVVSGTAVTGQKQKTTFTIQEATNTSTFDTQKVKFNLNGVEVLTAAVTEIDSSTDDIEDIGEAIVAAINGYVGKTVASEAFASNTSTVTVESDSIISIAGLAAASTASHLTFGAVTAVNPLIAAAAPTVTKTADGVAATTAATYTSTVDASKITGATEMASVNSTGTVSFTNMVSEKAVVEGNGANTNGASNFTYKATATSVDLELQNGVNDGDITIDASAATSATLTSKGAANKVGNIDLDKATAVTIDAASKLSMVTGHALSVDATSEATLTIKGSGAVDLAALDAGFDTVDASANTGGVTAQLGTSTDTKFTGSAGSDKITASTTDAIGDTAKLAVDGGAGTDTLVVAAAADLNTAKDGGRYTNFEILDISDSHDVSLVSGITSVVMNAAASKSITGLNATQAADITVTGDQGTAFTVALTDATGTSDSVTINATSATATTNVDIAGLTVAGFETLNFNATTGTAGTDSDLSIASSGADKLTAVNFTGSADIKLSTGGNFAKAVTIDATGMTGAFDLTGDLTAASVVKATAKADSVALGAVGSTYQLGAGNDSVTAVAAADLTDGAIYSTIDGGAGTDSLTLATGAAITLNDSHFTKLSNLEKIVSDNDGGAYAFSLTAGTEFSEAFAAGFEADIEVGDEAATLAAGSATTSIKFDVDSQSDAGKDINITTGTGNDEIIITTAAFTTSEVNVNTGAGNDSVTYTHSTSTLDLSSDQHDFDLGTGADTLTLSGYTSGQEDHVVIKIEAGDSLVGSYDVITGFDDNETNLGMVLDFDGTAAIASAVTSVDVAGFNRDQHVLSSSAAGLVSWTGTSASALSLSSKIAAVQAQFVSANDTVSFNHGSDSFVFHNDADGDSLVKLVGVTSTGLETSTGTTAGEFSIA